MGQDAKKKSDRIEKKVNQVDAHLYNTEALSGSAAELPRKAASSHKQESMRIYAEEFARLTNALRKTDSVFSKDTEQYKNLKKTLLQTAKNVAGAKGTENVERALKEGLRNAVEAIREYKDAHKSLPLNDRRLDRLKAMNRMERLYKQLNSGRENPKADTLDMFAEKLVQAKLIQKIKTKAPDADKAKAMMLNQKAFHADVDRLANDWEVQLLVTRKHTEVESAIKQNGQKVLGVFEEKLHYLAPDLKIADVSKMEVEAPEQPERTAENSRKLEG